MPGRKPRSRHAGSAPQAAPPKVGGGKGRGVRGVPHRCSRKGVGEMFRGFSSGKDAVSYRQKLGGQLFSRERHSGRWYGGFCLSS